MALLFCDSFDHYSKSQLTAKWTQFGEPVGSLSISSGNGRYGTNSLRLSNSGPWVRKTLGVARQTLVVGMAVRYASALSYPLKLVTLEDSSSVQVDLRLLTDGTLQVTRAGTVLGTTGTALAAGTWYYVEFKAKIDNTVGVVTVRVNGVTALTLSGVDTQATGNATANAVVIGGMVSFYASITIDIDDLYVLDDTGGAPLDGFLGDVRVTALTPNGAGSRAEWTPSAGANWACVDEIPPNDDTDYVSSATAGVVDLYALADLPVTAAQVFAVQTALYARKDDAGTRQVRARLKGGASEAVGATQNLSDSYGYLLDVFADAPGGTPWTVADVNALEAGVELVS